MNTRNLSPRLPSRLPVPPDAVESEGRAFLRAAPEKHAGLLSKGLQDLPGCAQGGGAPVTPMALVFGMGSALAFVGAWGLTMAALELVRAYRNGGRQSATPGHPVDRRRVGRRDRDHRRRSRRADGYQVNRLDALLGSLGLGTSTVTAFALANPGAVPMWLAVACVGVSGFSLGYARLRGAKV